MSLCRSCGQKIKWIETVKGKKMPVDPELVYSIDCEEGDILIDEEGETHRVNHFYEPFYGYVSHFVTCLEADSWRKK